MNWVGGVRRRVLLKEEEKRRQEQFFALHASAKLSKSGKGDPGNCQSRENLVSSHQRPKFYCRQRKTEEVVYKHIQGGASLSHSKGSKLEVQGIESKKKKENRRGADRVHQSKINDTSAKVADNRSRKIRERDENSRYHERKDSKRQARKDTRSQSSNSICLPENKENHITESSALSQKYTDDNLKKVKKCSNQKLDFDNSETMGDIHDSQKVQDTINAKTFLDLKEDNNSKHVHLTKNHKKRASNMVASSKDENKKSRTTNIRKEQADTSCNSHEKGGKVKSSKDKPKNGKGTQAEERTPVPRLLSGAPRLRRILSLSPGRHNGQIWVPWNLPVDNLNDYQSRMNISSETLQLDKISAKDAGSHSGKPHLNQCPKENSRTMVPPVSTTNREEEIRLTLLLGNRVKENTNYIYNKQINIEENENKNDDCSQMTDPRVDCYATSNSENPLTRNKKLSMRDLHVIYKETKDICVKEAEKPISYTLGKPKLSTCTRKVYEVESGLSFARERKDKTPYLDRTIATPWRSGTYFQTPGGSSGKSSSKTPTDPTLDGSLEDPLGTQEDPEISRVIVDGIEVPTVCENLITCQEINFREDSGTKAKQIGFLSEQNNISSSNIIQQKKSLGKLHEDKNTDSPYSQTSMSDGHSDIQSDMYLFSNRGKKIQTNNYVNMSKRSSTSLPSPSVKSLQEISNRTMLNHTPEGDNYSVKRSRDIHFIDSKLPGNQLPDRQKSFSENDIRVDREMSKNIESKDHLITYRLNQGYRMQKSRSRKTAPMELKNKGTFTNLFDLVKCNQTNDK